MSDMTNHPAHYNAHEIECVEVSERLSAALAQALQYLWRADEKGTPDLCRGKAIWWLRRERARLLANPDARAACDDAPLFGLLEVIAPFDAHTGEAMACIWRVAWGNGTPDDTLDLAIRLIEMRMAADVANQAKCKLEKIMSGPVPKCPAEKWKEDCDRGCALGQWCPRMPRPS
jgi:hypothetical protein